MVIDYRGMSVWVFASQPRTLWGVMNDKGTGPFSLYQYCNNLAEKHPIFSTIRATHTMQTASWCTGQWGPNKSHIISWTWGNHRKTIQLQSSNQTYFTFILWYPDRQDWTWVAWRCRWQTQQDNKAHLKRPRGIEPLRGFLEYWHKTASLVQLWRWTSLNTEWKSSFWSSEQTMPFATENPEIFLIWLQFVAGCVTVYTLLHFLMQT